MKFISVSVVLLAASSVVSAQVFKCTVDGKTVYQSLPCAAEGGRVELNTAAPSAEDAQLARQRAEDDQRSVRRLEAERERNREIAAAEREIEARERAARERECARYAEEAVERENRAQERYSRSLRERDRKAARAMRDKHFSECFGSF